MVWSIYQVGELESWERAAAWFASLHARLRTAWRIKWDAARLLRVDAAFLADVAGAFAAKFGDSKADRATSLIKSHRRRAHLVAPAR